MILSQRLHHFGLAVADLESVLVWYCEKLDLQVEKRFTLREASLDIVKLISPGGVRVELLTSLKGDGKVRDDGGVVHPSAKHLCFEVDDIEETAAELRRRNVRIAQEPKFIAESGEKNCWIKDVEGNMIEFIEDMNSAQRAE